MQVKPTDINGTVPVSKGGTGATTLTGYMKGNGTGAVTASATIAFSDITGTVPLAQGGTGATAAPAARTNLGAAASGANTDITSLAGLSSGTAAAPSITFSGDTNTGIYRTGTDGLGITTGGVLRLVADNTGLVTVAANLAVNGDTTLGDAAGDSVTVNAQTINALNDTTIFQKTVNGGATAFEVRNPGTGNATARLVLRTTDTADAFVVFNMDNNSGSSPSASLASGAGLTGGISHNFAGYYWRDVGGTEWMRLTTSNLEVKKLLLLTGTEANQLGWTLGSQSWKLSVNSAGKWYLHDVTNSRFPINVEAGSLNDSLTILSSGDVSTPNRPGALGFKGLPPNAKTASYTLALSDMGKHISITTGGVVVPANASVAFPVGSVVWVYNDSASNQTVSITTDTMYLAGTATTGSRTLAQRGLAMLVKVATTTWLISGQGVT